MVGPHGRRLREPVPLRHPQTQPLLTPERHLDTQGRRARRHVTEGREIVSVDDRVFRQGEHDGRNQIGPIDLLVLDDLQELLEGKEEVIDNTVLT